MTIKLLSKTQILRSVVCGALAIASSAKPLQAQNSIDTALANALQQSLNSVRAQQQVQGISAAAFIPGKGMWRGVSGNSHAGMPIDSNMLFAIASATKTFVAAETFKLIEDGLLHLDDSVGSILPPRAFVSPSITVRQLLGHTSGMGDYLNAQWEAAMFADPNRVWGLGEALDSFLTAPTGLPGSPWNYANSNYVLLGLIIEAKTGDSLHVALRNSLLQPLQLANTYMRSLESFPNAIPHNWTSPTMNPALAADSSATPHTALWSSAQADGGLFASAADLANWCRQLYSGSVISTASLNQMLNFTPVNGGYFTGYGLGAMRFRFNNRNYWGHAGNYYGYAATMLYHEPSGISLAVLVNQDCISPIIAGSLMNSLLNTIATSVQSDASNSIVSIYPNPASGRINVSVPGSKFSQATVIVRDQFGRAVFKSNASTDNLIIPVSAYPRGQYFITVSLEGKQWSQSLVLE